MGARTWLVAVAAAIVAPIGLFLWLVADPARNPKLADPAQHLTITTNVAVLAAFTALLVARGALQLRQYRILLVALGFMSMAGVFVVHGLTTPGVLLKGELVEQEAGTVAGLSGQLSLLAAAIFFAVRYTPLSRILERTFSPVRAIVLVGGALVLYGAIALTSPGAIAGPMEKVLTLGMPTERYYDEARGAYVERTGQYQLGGGYQAYGSQPYATGGSVLPPLSAVATIALLGFAAWRQGREFAGSRQPMQGALALSYLFLADAQVAQTLGPVFTLAWWQYHALMLLAVVIAVGALFVELDRRRGLERFLPSTVVERVLSGDRLSLAGERKVVTILFSDLRGSTALAEKLTPEESVQVVNAYLGAMARSVFANDGILDKFTGDGLMAIFGALPDPTSGATPAARAALEMRRLIGALNAERTAHGQPAILFGVGIHTGEVVLGAVGVPERSDYTALGDTVNTAARLESLTKQYGVDCVLSADTAQRIAQDAFSLRALGTTEIRGKAQPLAVSTLD